MAIGASTIGLYRFLYSTTFGQTIFRNGNLKKTDHKKDVPIFLFVFYQL